MYCTPHTFLLIPSTRMYIFLHYKEFHTTVPRQPIIKNVLKVLKRCVLFITASGTLSLSAFRFASSVAYLACLRYAAVVIYDTSFLLRIVVVCMKFFSFYHHTMFTWFSLLTLIAQLNPRLSLTFKKLPYLVKVITCC